VWQFVWLLCRISTNHYSEHVIERTDLPRHLIKSAAGDYLLQQTQPRVRFMLSLRMN